MAYKCSPVNVFLIMLLLLLLFTVHTKTTATSFTRRIQIITSNTSVIGAVMDMTSRAGKEARVAMEMAIDDFNAKTSQNATLYIRNSKGNLFGAIREGKPLHSLIID
ncbi:hypothetical protein HanRHA438_Chr10g0462611 [Helianthus annuus]|nr:hypothetical protein HanRHA438_Chr10g0462611 [Helianthus annuus]